jgi:hypothetical protein
MFRKCPQSQVRQTSQFADDLQSRDITPRHIQALEVRKLSQGKTITGRGPNIALDQESLEYRTSAWECGEDGKLESRGWPDRDFCEGPSQKEINVVEIVWEEPFKCAEIRKEKVVR